MASHGDSKDDSTAGSHEAPRPIPTPEQFSTMTTANLLDFLTTAITTSATTATTATNPKPRGRRPSSTRKRKRTDTPSTRGANLRTNLYDVVAGRITPYGRLKPDEPSRKGIIMWGPDEHIHRNYAGEEIGSLEEFERVYSWDRRLEERVREVEQEEVREVATRKSSGDGGGVKDEVRRGSRGISRGEGGRAEGSEEERKAEEERDQQAWKKSKLQLPDTDLLHAIHSYASDYYGAMGLGDPTSWPWDEGGRHDFLSMEASALLAFGMLLEEEGREVLGAEGDMVLVEPQGWEIGIREDVRTRWLVGGKVERPLIPPLESSDEGDGEDGVGIVVEEPRKGRRRKRSRTEDR